MNNPRDVYVYHVSSSADESLFEIRFHDGEHKKIIVYKSECLAQNCSPREVLESKIIDLYISLEGLEPQINFYFS